jgi:hypothetical protein
MSYSLNCECGTCTKQFVCTDRHVISGAISGIHQMPIGVGHIGAGSITISCFNYQKNQA